MRLLYANIFLIFTIGTLHSNAITIEIKQLVNPINGPSNDILATKDETISTITTTPSTSLTTSSTTTTPNEASTTTTPTEFTTTTTAPGCDTTGMITIGSAQFKLFTNRYTWEEAKQLCSDEGMIMAEPQDPPAVAQYLLDNYGNYFWLGASGNGLTFVWNSGGVLASSSPYWYSAPTWSKLDDCLMTIYASLSVPYDASPCTNIYHAICQCPAA